MTTPKHAQAAYRVRLDWGLAGARAMTSDVRPGDVAVVVDVLSFTTTLTVALERGIGVHPYPWDADGAAAYAAERRAVLAVGRREGLASGAVSLSPGSLENADGVERIVLPSPNGSSIAFALRDSGVVVVGASLRNAAAVGAWLSGRRPGRVSVVAAGERWPDGSLRPAVEDLWGAGAVLRALGPDGTSPEAGAAVAAYDAVRGDLPASLMSCASGRELVAAGFDRDVELAGHTDVAAVVPVLEGDAFGAAQEV